MHINTYNLFSTALECVGIILKFISNDILTVDIKNIQFNKEIILLTKKSLLNISFEQQKRISKLKNHVILSPFICAINENRKFLHFLKLKLNKEK